MTQRAYYPPPPYYSDLDKMKAKVLCPKCRSPLDTWVFDRRLGEWRGSGRGRNYDADDPKDGRARWVLYRCPRKDCRTESVWDTRGIHWAVSQKRLAEITWDDHSNHYWFDRKTGEQKRKLDWKEVRGRRKFL